ncbi:MAG: hypothetical protein Q9167_004110 [Letrouitia subvulpina]
MGELLNPVEKAASQPENPFASLIPEQSIAIVPFFTLESGVVLQNVPVAYSTRGKLNSNGDNGLIICHALSGSADVSDWWGPLMGGNGRAFDTSRFFIVCLNSLGSPYGSASPVTNIDGDPSLGRYGPEFPLTTIRDDVKCVAPIFYKWASLMLSYSIHKIVLQDLGVRQIAAVVGGSMGGMLVLEYAYFGKDYVRSIVPIATSSRHSAWGISWGEAQRQSIYCDPKYEDGYYSFDDPPLAGLGAARMSALLTYRSRNSFESRFGRNIPDPSRRQIINDNHRPKTPANEHWEVHNDGHKSTRGSRPASVNGSVVVESQRPAASPRSTSPPEVIQKEQKRATTYFSAQSYLRYQGEKFVKRFDGNCYIAITRKLDTHDVSRHRVPPQTPDAVSEALSQIQQPALIIGIESDGLFTFAEQQEIANGIPNSRLRSIDSPEGHDAFLLQFEQVNGHILEFFHEVLPDIMEVPGISEDAIDSAGDGKVGVVQKTSTFGEAEVGDITAW